VRGPRRSQSREAALRAAGGALRCVDAVLRGEVQNAFACVRPPGHHATPGRAMGFCLFNNVAVAALHARAEHGVQKIAIVDVDVHHGNGTEAGFAADADLLYASYHQYGNE
jgi:acetoin utilization deacetylase AcuC-like enzyme